MDVLNAAGVKPNQIAFEVVETDKVQRQRELKDVLRAYRKAGFKVALDDVGAGTRRCCRWRKCGRITSSSMGSWCGGRRTAGSKPSSCGTWRKPRGRMGSSPSRRDRDGGADAVGAGGGGEDHAGVFHARPQAAPLDAEIAVCALASIANASREASCCAVVQAA